jgi:hypothetical protein
MRVGRKSASGESVRGSVGESVGKKSASGRFVGEEPVGGELVREFVGRKSASGKQMGERSAHQWGVSNELAC